MEHGHLNVKKVEQNTSAFKIDNSVTASAAYYLFSTAYITSAAQIKKALHLPMDKMIQLEQQNLRQTKFVHLENLN